MKIVKPILFSCSLLALSLPQIQAKPKEMPPHLLEGESRKQALEQLVGHKTMELCHNNINFLEQMSDDDIRRAIVEQTSFMDQCFYTNFQKILPEGEGRKWIDTRKLLIGFPLKGAYLFYISDDPIETDYAYIVRKIHPRTHLAKLDKIAVPVTFKMVKKIGPDKDGEVEAQLWQQGLMYPFFMKNGEIQQKIKLELDEQKREMEKIRLENREAAIRDSVRQIRQDIIANLKNIIAVTIDKKKKKKALQDLQEFDNVRSLSIVKGEELRYNYHNDHKDTVEMQRFDHKNGLLFEDPFESVFKKNNLLNVLKLLKKYPQLIVPQLRLLHDQSGPTDTSSFF